MRIPCKTVAGQRCAWTGWTTAELVRDAVDHGAEVFYIHTTNRHLQVKLKCPKCGERSGALPKELWPLTVYAAYADEATKDNTDAIYAPCSYEGCDAEVTEMHHWAPRNTFLDADKWPISPLCQRHHSLWHSTMHNYQRNAKGVKV